jgi:hypothetical protein
VKQLIDLALRNGGPDNITCIVADVVDSVGGPVAPTLAAEMAGAAAHGDISALLRAASGGSGTPTGHGPTSGAPGASLNGHRGRRAAAVSVADDEDDDDEYDEPRRRWPVVTSVFVVLILLVVGGLYVGYRATQGNYYLASDGAQLSIYRGINQKIAWINLSHVYRRTGVPTSHVPGDLTIPTTPTSLGKTMATLTSIKRAYACDQDQKALDTWTAKYAGKVSAPANKKTHTPAVVIPPKPVVPGSCPAAGVG